MKKLILSALLALGLTACGRTPYGADTIEMVLVPTSVKLVAPDFAWNTTCGSVYRRKSDLPLHISLPVGADPDFIPVVKFAADWWENEVPGLVAYDPNWTGPNDADHITLALNDVPVQQLATVGLTGWHVRTDCTLERVDIDINFIHPGADAGHGNAEVVAHEVGHALGLAHDKDPVSLMYPSVHGSPFILLPETKAEMQYIYGAFEGN